MIRRSKSPTHQQREEKRNKNTSTQSKADPVGRHCLFVCGVICVESRLEPNGERGNCLGGWIVYGVRESDSSLALSCLLGLGLSRQDRRSSLGSKHSAAEERRTGKE